MHSMIRKEFYIPGISVSKKMPTAKIEGNMATTDIVQWSAIINSTYLT